MQPEAWTCKADTLLFARGPKGWATLSSRQRQRRGVAAGRVRQRRLQQGRVEKEGVSDVEARSSLGQESRGEGKEQAQCKGR
jgi:hypothetical protein